MHKEGFCRLLLELYAELYFLITAKFIDFVADVIFKALHVFLVCADIEDVDENLVSWFDDHFAWLRARGHNANGDFLAQGQQAHAMSRRDDKNVVIRRDMPKLSALLNGTFHRSVNAAGGLSELEGGGGHKKLFKFQSFKI